jgi:hypothetical protein
MACWRQGSNKTVIVAHNETSDLVIT